MPLARRRARSASGAARDSADVSSRDRRVRPARSAHAAHQSAAHQRRRLHPAGPLPGARGRARHDQAALHAGADRRRCCATPAARSGWSTRPPSGCRPTTLIARARRRGLHARRSIVFPTHDADPRRRRRRDGEAEGALRRADVLLRPARLDAPAESMERAPDGRRHVRRRARGRDRSRSPRWTRSTARRRCRA